MNVAFPNYQSPARRGIAIASVTADRVIQPGVEMSIFPARATLVTLLALSVLGTEAGMAQSADTTSSKPMDHSSMTPAQHAAMHGGGSAATTDTSFVALQARGKMAMGVD